MEQSAEAKRSPRSCPSLLSSYVRSPKAADESGSYVGRFRAAGWGEDDLTHLPEILEHHDLTKDLAAGSVQEFHKRSMDNLSNRCLHHHVFDEHNSSELLSKVGFDVLALEFRLPFHICILARMVRS